MSEFLDAFSGGIRLAKIAADARREIDEVFKRLSEDVLQASGGAIEIERVSKNSTLNAIYRVAMQLGGVESTNAESIAARRVTSKGGWTHLAEWIPSEDGYPCVVAFAGSRNTCMDAQALSSVLADMLSYAGTGRKLLELMSRATAHASEVSPEKGEEKPGE